MGFNFKNTQSAKSTEFFKPGVYRFKIAAINYGTFPKGTPYLEVIFKTKEGKELSEKFAITENSINRIQYLHEFWLGKPCATEFETAKEVFTYMKKKLLEKAVVKPVIVGGDDLGGGKVYAHLPYTDFIDNEGKLELGEFEKGSEEWKEYVIKKDAQPDSRTAGRSNGLLNEDDDDQTTDDDDDDQTEDGDDWGEDDDDADEAEEEEEVEEKKKPAAKKPAAKKPAAKAAKKETTKKKPVKKAEPEEDIDEEDVDSDDADDQDEW